MKVLILVLSAMKDCYGEMMRVQQETWDCLVLDHPQTQTLYYVGKGGPIEDNIFVSEHYDEELEQISPRTLEAFKHSLTLEWDFMARTHSSTYVHKKNLVDFIEENELPLDNTLVGLLTTGERPFLWGGGSYILSRDVVKKIVENPEVWNIHVMEDNSLTDAANALEIPLNGSGRMISLNQLQDGTWFAMSYGLPNSFNFTDFADINQAQPHFYIRCKQDLRRDEDLRLMRLLKQHYT